MRRGRRSAGAALAGLGALTLAVSLAVTPGAGAAPGGPSQDVTFVLKSANPALLNYLARTHNLPKSERLAGLAATVQPAAERQRIIDTITAAGFRVRHVTPWSISTSAPRSVVQNALHTTSTRSGLRLPNNARTAAPLWAALGSTVSTIVASDGSGPKRHPMNATNPVRQAGSDFQMLYGAKSPASGSLVTVATLQFSSWDSSALATFAQLEPKFGGLGMTGFDPVGTGQYTEVPVDVTPSTPLDSGGESEVALDQETILAVAPRADQRAYFAPNTDAGEVDALNVIAADAASGKYNMVALSISWGLCEPEMTPSVMDAMHAAFQNIVAAGVTVFASSGDSGAYDCAGIPGTTHGNELTVDSPANDPLVVGVGGTSVDSSTAQSSWVGSGGGVSSHFPLPAYQQAMIPAGTGRNVPDIAADADPSSGMKVYYIDPASQMGAWHTIGGTSLASPIMAASLANVLSAQDRTTGVGDIHATLYTAKNYPSYTAAVHDIADGANNGSNNSGFSAGVGYDNVTGLGYPTWSSFFPAVDAVPTVRVGAYVKTRAIPLDISLPNGAVAAKWGAGLTAVTPQPTDCTGLTQTTKPATVTASVDGSYTLWVAELTGNSACNIITKNVIVDTVAPSASLSLKQPDLTKSTYWVTWGTTDALSAPLGVQLIARHPGSSVPDWTRPASQAGFTGVTTKTGVPGRTYNITMTAYDKAMNATVRQASITIPFDDANFALKGWTKTWSTTAYFMSFSKASSPSAQANKAITARSYAVQYTSCPSCGKLGVYVNGKLAKVVDTYSATTKSHVTVTVFKGSSASRNISVRPMGVKSAKSNGLSVQFDGFVATP